MSVGVSRQPGRLTSHLRYCQPRISPPMLASAYQRIANGPISFWIGS